MKFWCYLTWSGTGSDCRIFGAKLQTSAQAGAAKIFTFISENMFFNITLYVQVGIHRQIRGFIEKYRRKQEKSSDIY